MNKNSNIHHRWSGINTKSLSLRISEGEHPKKAKADFFRDFGEILEEWWSLYENEISITRTGVKAKVKRVKRYNSGAGVGSSIHSEISVDMRSDLTVYVGGQSKKFSVDESLYNIMLWVDRIAEKRGAYASDQELRKKVIRLAYQNPSIRADVLPLLKTSADFTKEELYDRGFYRQIQRELGRHRDITFGCCSASSTDNREALLVVVSLKDQWQYPHEEDYDGWEEILKKMKSAVSRVRELNKFDYYFDTYKIENHQDIDARIYIYGRK